MKLVNGQLKQSNMHHSLNFCPTTASKKSNVPLHMISHAMDKLGTAGIYMKNLVDADFARAKYQIGMNQIGMRASRAD